MADRDILHQVLAATEAERRRLGRDIHDGIAQALAQLLIAINLVETMLDHDPRRARRELRTLRRLAAATLDEVRRIVADLRPLHLERGLVNGLRQFLAELKYEHHFEVALAVTGTPPELNPTVATAAFRIVQEALANARRHADARRVGVRLRFGRRALVLLVRDDGNGFRLPARLDHLPQLGRYGLVSIDERVTALGGRWRVVTAPGRGTRLLAALPYAAEPPGPGAGQSGAAGGPAGAAGAGQVSGTTGSRAGGPGRGWLGRLVARLVAWLRPGPPSAPAGAGQEGERHGSPAHPRAAGR